MPGAKIKSLAKKIVHNIRQLHGRKLPECTFQGEPRSFAGVQRYITHETGTAQATAANTECCDAIGFVMADIWMVKKLPDRKIEKHENTPRTSRFEPKDNNRK